MNVGYSIAEIESVIESELSSYLAAAINDAGVTLGVGWTNGNVRADVPAVSLSWSKPLTPRGLPDEREYTRASRKLVTFANPTSGKVFTLRVNNRLFTATADGSLVNLRDAFLALVNASHVPVTAVDRPADGELRLDADVDGAIRSVAGTPSADVVPTDLVTSLVRESRDYMDGRLRVICRTRPRVVPTAVQLASGVTQCWRSRIDALTRIDTAIAARPLSSFDLSGQQGADTEQRVELEYAVTATAYRGVVVQTIQTATIAGDVAGNDTELTVTA